MKGADRISLLPDCLLHDILSFLNTKSVVQTCVLSKRWKTLWTQIPILNFDFESGSSANAPHSKPISVKRFVFRFLSEHRCNFIKKLSFSSSVHTDEAPLIVDLLIWYARHHTVQELCLNTFNTLYPKWPLGLSTCYSLTVLKLKLSFTDDWGDMDLPWLRILEIEYEWKRLFHDVMLYLSHGTDMFSDCPNLESLVIVNYLCERVDISAPKLENFEFSSCYSIWELSFPQVKLLAPSLKTVKFSNILPNVTADSEFSCLHQVNIAVDDSDFDGDDSALPNLKVNMSQLLKVFHNARSFTLPFMAMEVLMSVPSSLSNGSFCNLRYVKLKSKETNQMTSFSISTLMNTLQCPNLEKLEVDLNQDALALWAKHLQVGFPSCTQIVVNSIKEG